MRGLQRKYFLYQKQKYIATFVASSIVLFTLWYLFSGAYRVSITFVVPDNKMPWITGSDLLKRQPAEVVNSYGYRIIHQSWKTHAVPSGLMLRNFNTWSINHPDALHVLWSNEENEALVKEHYPEFLILYHSPLVSDIQRADIARVLYLHRYGGVYADLDFEAKANLIHNLPSSEALMYIVRSPALLNEVLQNSLMVSKENNLDFWYEVVRSTNETIDFVSRPYDCKQHGWSGCDDLFMFHNYFLGPIVNLVMTAHMTGSPMIERTYAIHRTLTWNRKWMIYPLPLDDFFMGKYTKHHQMSTWVSVFKVARRLILVISVGLFGIIVLTMYLTHKWTLKEKK